MATSTNTLKTRVQLKSDTEENWNKVGPKEGSPGFIPLLGELIIYTSDDTHSFSRLKVGDGNTNVVSLPFIDAGTINGELLKSYVQTYEDRNSFPRQGIENILYIDLSTYLIYCYTNSGGYTQLSNFIYSTTTVSHITEWIAGSMTNISCVNGKALVDNGTRPTLNYNNVQVIRNITKGGGAE